MATYTALEIQNQKDYIQILTDARKEAAETGFVDIFSQGTTRLEKANAIQISQELNNAKNELFRMEDANA